MYLLLGVCIDEDDTCGDPLYSSNRSTPRSRYNFAIHPGIILLQVFLTLLISAGHAYVVIAYIKRFTQGIET